MGPFRMLALGCAAALAVLPLAPSHAADPIGGTIPGADTTTSLSVSPVSPQDLGTSITLDAAVTSRFIVPDGTVEFLDGSTVIDTETLSTSGTASYTTSSLAGGDHTLTAHYVPADPTSFNESTSPPQSFHVRAQQATTTAIAVNPGTGFAGEDVVLSATVAPHVPGTVQFTDGSTPIGSPVAVDASGFAEIVTKALGEGTHTVTATFTPADTASYSGSSDTSLPFTLGAKRTAPPDDQQITVDVPVGQLDLSTPYSSTNPIDIGTLSLSPDATKYVGSKQISGISVTDTRPGNQGWTLTGLSSNLSSPGTPPKIINGQNVGLINLVETSHSGAGTTTTFDNPGANPPVQPADGGSLGLGGTAKVAATGTGPGSSGFAGTVTLTAPTSTRAGHYVGILTLTVVGN